MCLICKITFTNWSASEDLVQFKISLNIHVFLILASYKMLMARSLLCAHMSKPLTSEIQQSSNQHCHRLTRINTYKMHKSCRDAHKLYFRLRQGSKQHNVSYPPSCLWLTLCHTIHYNMLSPFTAQVLYIYIYIVSVFLCVFYTVAKGWTETFK